jgi:glycosyltransferase involved in cell wall biosynthesis
VAGAGPVLFDLSAVQSPDHRGRGVGRWAYELAVALERVRPDLVGCYLLDPAWPPPGRLDDLLESGKVAYAGSPQAERAWEAARVFHALSPFELARPLSAIRPEAVDRLGLAFCTTVYDLIPLRRSEEYLRHPAQRQRYLSRLEVVRHADAALAISGAAANDVVELVGLEAARSPVVGTGVTAAFAPPASREAALAQVVSEVPSLRGPFVLYTGGTDGRKNIAGLIEAFGRLGARRLATHQLVIVGELPPLTDNHFRHLARLGGIEDRLVLTGFVPDETLVRLCQAGDLVVFPSFAEGYGLPVAEGLACGAVAAVSDLAPLDELVPDRRARFDPADPDDMARVIERCLADRTIRDAVLGAGPGVVTRWETVAERAAAVYERLAGSARSHGRPRPGWRPSRRIAILSPFPPLTSGISGYSAELVKALAKTAAARQRPGEPPVEIDCYADGLDRYPLDPEPIDGRPVRDARRFVAVDAAIGGYDRVVYVLGNSECHAGALAALRRRPGIAICHDVRLSGLMRFSGDRYGAVPGGLAGTISRAYDGQLPAGLGEHNTLTAADLDRFGLLLIREILDCCERVLVSSPAAMRLAELDAGPARSDRLGVLPFAVGRYGAAELAVIDEMRSRRAAGVPATQWRIGSFGIVDPAKRPEVLVAAIARLAAAGRPVHLSLVGPVSTEGREAVEATAERLGVGDLVELTGTVSGDEYLRHLGAADVAVQLREGHYGESSGAVAECLSAGVPTIVSGVGWMGGLPRDAVATVGRTCTADELASEIERWMLDAAGREALGRHGREHAAQHSFDEAAAVLLDELGY